MWNFPGTGKPNKGFLLLEVLVSVTLITAGLVYVVRSFSSSSRAIGTATNYLKAVGMLEGKLFDLEVLGAVDEGDDDGKFEDDPTFGWKSSVGRHKELPLNSVNVSVGWGRTPQRQEISAFTYMWKEDEE